MVPLSLRWVVNQRNRRAAYPDAAGISQPAWRQPTAAWLRFQLATRLMYGRSP
jgi:hypothetical protein